MRVFFTFIWVCLSWVCFSQHQQKLHIITDMENKTLKVKQEIEYHNISPDTLYKLTFYDWNNAFSSKNSALAKRFSDEFIRAFHLAQDKDRGFTAISSCIDENGSNLNWYRPEKIDLIEIELNSPILPNQTQKIWLNYTIKLPNERFTRFGFTDNTKLYLRDCFITPCKYVNKGFISYSNENLDDRTNVPITSNITIVIPNDFYIASSYEVENIGQNTFKLSGENYLESDIIISKNKEFTNFKNEFIEVTTSLEPKRLEEYQQVIAIDKITRFVNEKLGNSVASKILVSQEDYDKQPFYGLNQLPAFLNPYPNEFMYEMKFLKTYLNNYLKANLQLNPRNESWIYDGIQVFVMMQYIEEYYPDMKMAGNIAKWKLLRAYNIINIDFNQQYNYLYMLMARKNLDQAVGSPKNRLVKFNEKIAGKYRSGLNFKYLDSYLGNQVVEKSIQEFINLNSECTSSKYEFEYVLKKNTSKDIDWFFTTLVNSRDLIDFKFGKIDKNAETLSVTIKNKTRTNVPISFYELKNDSIVYQKWIENIKTDTTFVVPRNNADKLTLNYYNEIPEFNLRNNWKSLKGFFFNNRPLKFNFFRDLEEPYYNQVFYVPEFEYNLYDGLAVGMNINNKSLLNKPIEFSATPYFSPNTQSLVGKASVALNQNIRDEGRLYRIKYYVSGNQFHYAPNSRYTKITPTVQFLFRDPDLRVNKTEFVQLKQLYINRENTNQVILDQNTENYNVFDAKYGNFQSEGTKHYSFLTNIQVANSFGKLSTEIHYRKLFEDNRQITLRLFAGTFIYRSTNSDYFSFGLDRPTDYMFEQNFLGRSETTGLYSQQYVYAEGGFKSMLDVRYANQWMVTTNAAFNVWNWIQVYGDLGMFKNDYDTPKFVYDSGVHLNLVPDYFELFFPVYSSNGFELNNPNYGQRIRFVVTLSPQTLISLFTRRWF